MTITQIDAPLGSLIAPFAAQDGHHVDCFETPIGAPVGLPAFIRAFYTQPLFRAERLVLRIAARAPSTDAEVDALAQGTADRFAVWTVTERRADQILLADRSGRTMSFLMATDSHLRFGSVVVPVPGRGGKPTLGPVFQNLLGPHLAYSRALLAGAVRRL